MARWAGWGAGPASAGAAGPTRAFLVVMMVIAGFSAVRFGLNQRWAPTAVSALCTAYFGMRLYMTWNAGKRQ